MPTGPISEINWDWIKNPIGEPIRNMALVADFDDDGMPDIFGTKRKGEFSWAQNKKNGVFNLLHNIEPGEGDYLQGVVLLKSGDRIDIVLSWHRKDNGVQSISIPTFWY